MTGLRGRRPRASGWAGTAAGCRPGRSPLRRRRSRSDLPTTQNIASRGRMPRAEGRMPEHLMSLPYGGGTRPISTRYATGYPSRRLSRVRSHVTLIVGSHFALPARKRSSSGRRSRRHTLRRRRRACVRVVHTRSHARLASARRTQIVVDCSTHYAGSGGSYPRSQARKHGPTPGKRPTRGEEDQRSRQQNSLSLDRRSCSHMQTTPSVERSTRM